MPDTPVLVLDPGEDLMVLERVVVAPSSGVFTPFAPEVITSEGELVDVGQAIGTVESSGRTVAVRSAFRGFLMGMLAHEGERMREGEPVAWLRLAAA